MSNQTNTFALAIQAFQNQDFVNARRLLLDCDPRQAAHLRGLVERRLGHFEDAKRFLGQALKYEPGNHEIYNNQALLLLDLEDAKGAIESLSHALALKPDFVAAQRTFGRALRLAGEWRAAKEHYTSVLSTRPEDTSFQFGLGVAELESGEIERALARFERLLSVRTDDSAVFFMHGRAALEAGQEETARRSLLAAHTAEPTSLTLRELARLYWMLGDRDAFDTLLTPPFATADMATVAMSLLRMSGASPETVIAAAGTRSLTAAQNAIAAQAGIDAENADLALDYARRCVESEPVNDAGMTALISALLMTGEAASALEQARKMRALQPNAQQWIAYEATALRILDPGAYTKLVDINHHVRAFDLPVPDGYADIGEFNRAMLEALDRLQVFEAQPIDQSLRQGTQTARDLTTVDDPVIRAYLAALDTPIRAYMAAVGADPGHPLSQRNTGDYRLSGCWSVRLTGGGFHVNHMHPEGWISSAYYVCVPELDEDDRSGWIKFSEPPFSTRPVLEPERWIKPSAGMLVLFPSFLWHGTAPIEDDAVRVTAPFDAVPS